MDSLSDSDLLSAYNKLTLLLTEPHSNQLPPDPHLDIENRIDTLAKLLETENNKCSIEMINEESYPLPLNNPIYKNKPPLFTNDEEHIATISSHGFMPRVEELYQLLAGKSSKGKLECSQSKQAENEQFYRSVQPAAKNNYFSAHDNTEFLQVDNELGYPENGLMTTPLPRKSSNQLNKAFLESYKTANLRKNFKKALQTTLKNDHYQSFAIYKKLPLDQCNKTVDRFFLLDQNRKEKIKSLKEEKEQETYREVKSKPTINPETYNLLSSGIKPIYLRTADILKNKETKTKQIKDEQELRNRSKDPDPTYRPDLSLTERKNCSWKTPRDNRKVISDLKEWQDRKNEKRDERQANILIDELKELTFHPKIKKKKRDLSADLYRSERTEDRLLKYEENYKNKIEKIRKEHTPDFEPHINRKSLEILKQKENLQKNEKRKSLFENTQSFAIKEREKYKEQIDEKDIKNRLKRQFKITEIEYDLSKKFLIDTLEKHKKENKRSKSPIKKQIK